MTIWYFVGFVIGLVIGGVVCVIINSWIES